MLIHKSKRRKKQKWNKTLLLSWIYGSLLFACFFFNNINYNKEVNIPKHFKRIYSYSNFQTLLFWAMRLGHWSKYFLDSENTFNSTKLSRPWINFAIELLTLWSEQSNINWFSDKYHSYKNICPDIVNWYYS